MGEWEKFPGNPILKGGNGWSCPGHGTIYPGPSGTLDALYHAYPEGKGRLAGRQMIADSAFFSADNWLKIGTGTPPPRSPGAPTLAFKETFRGRLNANWEWPFMRKPGTRVNRGLRLTASSRGRDRFDAGVLARRTATAELHRRPPCSTAAGLRGKARGGIASYRNDFEGIGLSVGRDADDGLAAQPRQVEDPGAGQGPGRRAWCTCGCAPAATSPPFQVSADGKGWRTVGRSLPRPRLRVGPVRPDRRRRAPRLGGLPQRLAQRELKPAPLALLCRSRAASARHA